MAGRCQLGPFATDLFALRRTPFRAKSGCEQLQQTAALFNHLVGAREQRCRDFEAERFYPPETSSLLIGKLKRLAP